MKMTPILKRLFAAKKTTFHVPLSSLEIGESAIQLLSESSIFTIAGGEPTLHTLVNPENLLFFLQVSGVSPRKLRALIRLQEYNESLDNGGKVLVDLEG